MTQTDYIDKKVICAMIKHHTREELVNILVSLRSTDTMTDQDEVDLIYDITALTDFQICQQIITELDALDAQPTRPALPADEWFANLLDRLYEDMPDEYSDEFVQSIKDAIAAPRMGPMSREDFMAEMWKVVGKDK